ncbi:hypothetical protein [Halarcobacter anaerophilus]|uniref:Uncharacterized protein n=1 Tax=Halarcobacter anaerophilus TaxID=877500 RepID=A0A4Q0Y0P6_9BACT|nr:hypothetical protein [Halarcobacter anaerophilus]QDF28971.1 hypothetical protein AANAER_1491 [Halarcobacter anaerophilus]RXJ63606.1 hypothetical protein CRV06_05280 [Halarcobacter anaerophilus]
MKKLLFLLLFTNFLFAEKSEIVNYLLNDKATMWDIGILKTKNMHELATDITKNRVNNTYTTGTVYYDEFDNKIKIHINIYNQDKKTNNELENLCKRELNNLKHIYTMNSDYINNFKHSGFIKRDEPKQFELKLKKITYLEIWLMKDTLIHKAENILFECSTNLLKNSKIIIIKSNK